MSREQDPIPAHPEWLRDAEADQHSISDRADISVDGPERRNARYASGAASSSTTEENLTKLRFQPDGAELLDRIRNWFARFIAVTDPLDLCILALWVVHTYLVVELGTTPRLQIDSVIFGSGKTTLLDHLKALCWAALHAADLSSPALIGRLLGRVLKPV